MRENETNNPTSHILIIFVMKIKYVLLYLELVISINYTSMYCKKSAAAYKEKRKATITNASAFLLTND